MRVFKDKILECCDCHKSWVFTAGEQNYYEQRQLNEPKRCLACRELRKQRAAGNEVARGR